MGLRTLTSQSRDAWRPLQESTCSVTLGMWHLSHQRGTTRKANETDAPRAYEQNDNLTYYKMLLLCGQSSFFVIAKRKLGYHKFQVCFCFFYVDFLFLCSFCISALCV